jgi:hypothetical protein
VCLYIKPPKRISHRFWDIKKKSYTRKLRKACAMISKYVTEMNYEQGNRIHLGKLVIRIFTAKNKVYGEHWEWRYLPTNLSGETRGS